MPKQTLTIGQEQCWLKFALADSSLEEGSFRGVASVFGSLVQSWMPTVLLPGAFTKTIRESGDKVKILHQHDLREPIGVPTRLGETETGLEIEGRISQTTRGKDDLILMRDGVVDELSIGFDPIEGKQELVPLTKAKEMGYVKNPSQWAELKDEEMVRVLKEVRLWEVSLVTWAADPMAKIQAVHHLHGDLYEKPLEAFAAKWEVQSCICPKDKWDGVDAAKKWLADHGYKTSKIDETEESWRFRQRDPDDFTAFRTICINPGRETPMDECKVKAIYGKLRNLSQAAAGVSVEDLQLALQELYEGKILSSKNKKLLQDAVAAINALIKAAEPPENEQTQALTVGTEQLDRLGELAVYFA